MNLRVEWASINPKRRTRQVVKKAGSFYGSQLTKRTTRKWRVIVEGAWALRTGFERRIDAEMAMNGLNKCGLDTVEKIVAVGWQEVQRIMFEALQW